MPAHQVFVIDAMGELMPFFAASDVAFVGGSLVPIGGHNVLEPAALSRPVLVGPHTFNFEDITQILIREGGAERVARQRGTGRRGAALLRDPAMREQMGEARAEVFESQRGAVQRVMGLIDGCCRSDGTASSKEKAGRCPAFSVRTWLPRITRAGY